VDGQTRNVLAVEDDGRMKQEVGVVDSPCVVCLVRTFDDDGADEGWGIVERKKECWWQVVEVVGRKEQGGCDGW